MQDFSNLKLRLQQCREKLDLEFDQKSGGIYCISGLALEEATLNVVVVYTTFDLKVSFTRGFDDFLEKFRTLEPGESLELTRESRIPL